MISGWGFTWCQACPSCSIYFSRLVPRFLCCFGLLAGRASSVMILGLLPCLFWYVIGCHHSSAYLCPTLVLLVFAMDCPGQVGGCSIRLHSSVYSISIGELLTHSMSDDLSASGFVDGLNFCPNTLDCHRLPLDKPKS